MFVSVIDLRRSRRRSTDVEATGDGAAAATAAAAASPFLFPRGLLPLPGLAGGHVGGEWRSGGKKRGSKVSKVDYSLL